MPDHMPPSEIAAPARCLAYVLIGTLVMLVTLPCLYVAAHRGEEQAQ